MNTFCIHHKSWAILLFSFLFSCLVSFGQKKVQSDSFDIKRASFYLPQPNLLKKYTSSIGVVYVVPPADWTHDIVAAPMFVYQGKYALPKGFNVQASLSTIFISNRILFGPFWDHKINEDYYLGLGWQLAWNYGRLYEFGFSTTITGWEQQPSITIGRMFKKSALILRGDLYWNTDLSISEGGNKVPSANPFINGYSFFLNYEQKLYKNRALSLGLQMDYVRYHIIAWPAFPVNGKHYWLPEFKISLNL